MIATKRDPTDAISGPQQPAIGPVEQTAILDASGTFSRDGALAIAMEIESQFADGCTACIVRLQRIDTVERAALATFADWIGGRLDEGLDVRISADQPEVWEAFAAVPDLQRALVPIADTSVGGHRRRVETWPADG